MTPKQHRVLAAVESELSRLGYSPTVAELTAIVGGSKQRTDSVLNALARQGYVLRDYATPRSLRLTAAGRAVLATSTEGCAA